MQPPKPATAEPTITEKFHERTAGHRRKMLTIAGVMFGLVWLMSGTELLAWVKGRGSRAAFIDEFAMSLGWAFSLGFALFVVTDPRDYDRGRKA